MMKFVFGLLFGLGLLSCKRETADATAVDADKPALASTGKGEPGAGEGGRRGDVPKPLACRKHSAEPLALGDASRASASDSAPDSLPFSIEVGEVKPFRDGFAVTALQSRSLGTVAVLAWVFSPGKKAITTDLLRVYGDVQPPQLAVGKDNAVLAIVDNDAGSSILRLVRFDGDKLRWGPILATGRDASTSLDLAMQGDSTLVVWDDYEKSEARAAIRGALFDAAKVELVREAFDVTGPKRDAEQPKLALRSDGYWLAYITYGKLSMKDRPSAAEGDSERFSVLDAAPRWVEVVPLDRQGSPMGEPISVTPPSRQVLAFELSTRPAGGLWLLWQDGFDPPGIEQPAVSLASVLPDGSVTRAPLEIDALGPGLPSLWPRDEKTSWLTFTDASSHLRLHALTQDGRPVGSAEAARLGAGRDALAYYGERFLVADSRGRGVAISTMSCTEAKTKGEPQE